MLTTDAIEVQLAGVPSRRRRERRIRGFFFAAAATSVVISVAIVASLAGEAWTFISNVDPGSLTEIGWYPRRGLFDISTLFAGTLTVAGIAMLVATPLGLGSAIYLSEYATARTRKVLKPALELLAGIPSVVLGFFALTFITPSLLRPIFGDQVVGFNMLAAGIGVGILTIPLVASVSEDALRAVPRSLREASYGLGATRMATSVRVVFPAAVSGVVASLIIAFSRAVGETMVVAIAAGATGGSLFGWNVFEPGQTMTAAMAALAIGSDQVRGDDYAFQSLFFLGLLLFAITLLLNVVSERFVRRVRQRY
ncbi:MAG: phosphate ABC transporter permease subunit PstC [Actinobacteria bacterium RBG_16_67_15]|jgi:phosphate transport system permease protein|nr:MAG: phosphate ABC transporter permease subunit PstC [Actinobacteria bacterium RBG_16_67_15]